MGGWGKPGDWWRTSKTISGGMLYDWGVHLLEYSLQLIDSEVDGGLRLRQARLLGGQTRWKADTNEDEGFAVVRFKAGQWLTLTISNLDSRPKQGMARDHGHQGHLRHATMTRTS